MTDVPILFEDDDLLAVEKPAGTLSHPNKGGKGKCAFRGRYDFEERKFEFECQTVWLLHRLDQDTSGVMLAAKSKEMADVIRERFKCHEVRKTYQALVTGLPRSASGTWRDHIQTNHSDDRVRSKIVTNRPPNAELNFKVVKKYRKEGLACLEIELVTGRTHQIRVQGASRFHHVLGDRIYGNFEANRKARRALGLKRFFLHAAAVELKHPGTGKWLRIESPLPDALEEALGRLQ